MKIYGIGKNDLANRKVRTSNWKQNWRQQQMTRAFGVTFTQVLGIDWIFDVCAYGPSIYRTKSGYCCDVEKNKVYLTFGLIFLNFRELVMVVHEIQILQMCQDQPHVRGVE